MVRVLMDEVVGTDYGQLDLWFSDDVEDDGDVQATCSGQVNGVAGAAIPGRIYLNLGRRSGGSSVRIEAHDGVTPCDAEWRTLSRFRQSSVSRATAGGPVGLARAAVSLSCLPDHTGSESVLAGGTPVTRTNSRTRPSTST